MNNSTVLIADDDAGIRTVLSQSLGRAGYDVRTTATAQGLWDLVEAGEGSLVVTDVVLPDGNGFDLIPRIRGARPELPIVVMSARNTILTAIAAAEHGAFEYLPKPFDLKVLTATVARALASPRETRSPSQSDDLDQLPLIGRSPAMQEIYRAIARLTRSDLTVLITGESGTGKELAARAIHDYGLRRSGPFVAVNVAAIPRDLVESELFGHERGAFTGAVARGIGRFEEAEGGTLFLDEIGDMSREAQTRLLRVLQEGEYTPVGARGRVETNVRIIAATNRELKQLIGQGLFREDLYYRLNVVPLRMPPLRERAQDIPDLVRHFLGRAHDASGASSGDCGPTARIVCSIACDALELLKRHSWPGNVRELENLVRRLALLHAEETISASVVASELDAASDAQVGETLEAALERFVAQFPRSRELGERVGRPNLDANAGLYAHVLAAMERPLLTLCLEASAGNQLRAAELLGLHRNTLRKKLREHGLEITHGVKVEYYEQS